MEIQQARREDLEAILLIYQKARSFMAAVGNPTQWAETYPPRELVEQDIAQGNCFLCRENGETLGVFSYFTQPDPTYARIYQGAWNSDAPYGTIHRVAVNTPGRGVAGYIFAECGKKTPHLRIDTHRDNKPMQKALYKSGFTLCGVIHLDDGQERIAFEKLP